MPIMETSEFVHLDDMTTRIQSFPIRVHICSGPRDRWVLLLV